MATVDWAAIDTVDPTVEVISLFNESNKFELVEGTPNSYIAKGVFVFAFLTLFKYLFNIYVPSFLEVILTLIIIVGSVMGLIELYKIMNKALRKAGFLGIIGGIFLLIVLNVFG